MKKNITINLCGRLFQIDEDAYAMLQQYIDSLRSHFASQEGGDEIVDDIEARVAELFDELVSRGTMAITIDHVRDIITRIGKPEQMDDATPEQDTAESAERHIGLDGVRSYFAGRRLYRNSDDKMLAGVLGGLAATFGGDPTLWRVAAVLLSCFWGFGILAYIVLAIVIPEAKTPEQVLQMHGKSVTPQNLANVVTDSQQPRRQPKLLNIMAKVILIAVSAFAAFTAAMLILAIFAILMTSVAALVIPMASNMPFSMESMRLAGVWQQSPWVLVLSVVSLLMVLFIPTYAIIHALASHYGKTASMSFGQRICWFVLWLVALGCMIPSMSWVNIIRERQHVYDSRQHYEKRHTYQGVEMNDYDYDFLRQNGWTLVSHEGCDHYTWSGDYYNGDKSVRYLDTYNEDCQAIFQAEREEDVAPGIYRLDCLVRTEGPGPCIYAVGDDKLVKDMPVYGNKGGVLADSIRQALRSMPSSGDHVTLRMDALGIEIEVDERDSDGDDFSPSARVSRGFGWSPVRIDSIVVAEAGRIAYGLSSDSAFTGRQNRAKWFSASDFTLTRIGDLPVNRAVGRHR